MDNKLTLKKLSFKLFCNFLLKHYCSIKSNTPLLPQVPFILCSNHQSHLDTPTIIYALNKKLADFKILAAKDHFQNQNQSFTQSVFDLILVDRQASMKETRRLITECQQAIYEGKNLLIYPEGTRNTSSQIQPFKQGGLYIALKLSIPIIPAAILGTAGAMGKGRCFIKPKQIQVLFDEPYLPQLPEGKLTKHVLQQQTQLLQSKVETLYQILQNKALLKTKVATVT